LCATLLSTLSALTGLRVLLAGLLSSAALTALLAALATLTALLVVRILLSHVFLQDIVEIHYNGQRAAVTVRSNLQLCSVCLI
jgi:hypothetical protein